MRKIQRLHPSDFSLRRELTPCLYSLDAFANGQPVGSPLTGIGAFVPGAHVGVFVGAASTTPSRPWSGFINYMQVWDVPLPLHDVEAWSKAVNPR